MKSRSGFGSVVDLSRRIWTASLYVLFALLCASCGEEESAGATQESLSVESASDEAQTPLASEADDAKDVSELANADTAGEGADPAVGEGVDNNLMGNLNPSDPPVETLIDQTAEAICGALFRCCNDNSLAEYFGFVRMNQRLMDAGFEARVPPNRSLSEESCIPLMREIYQVQPLGPWVEAVGSGQVSYHAEEAGKCLDTLRAAQCGQEVSDALLDSACLAFSAPITSKEPRKIFSRTTVVGQGCAPLSDGVGGSIYGTCDPTKGWCCRSGEDGFGDCSLDATANGVCVEASLEGDACGLFPTFAFCQAGLQCGVESGVCESPEVGALAQGSECYADSTVLGDCVDSFCDFMGSGLCESLKAQGEDCMSAWECVDGACSEGACVTRDFCLAR